MDADAPIRWIDCGTLSGAGLWDASGCCKACHEKPGACQELDLPLGCNLGHGPVRLTVCCRAGLKLDLESPELARLVGEPQKMDDRGTSA